MRDPNLRTLAISSLYDGADGMFLWAKLQLERICRLRNDRDIRKALKTLPAGLDDTFVRILEQIQARSPEDIAEVKKVFLWIIGSIYPLPLEAIAEAISIQPEDKCFDREGIANDIDDIVALCGSLVTVDRSNDATRIALAHYSIEEFLRSDRIKQTSVATFYLDPEHIHTELAKTCIQYLSILDIKALANRSDNPYSAMESSFLIYASQHWITHLCASGMDKETFQRRVLPNLNWFVDQKSYNTHYELWNQFVLCLMPRLERGYGRLQQIPCQPSVFYALRYKIDLLLDKMFPQGQDIHQRFWDGMTPLHVTVFAGDYSSTERLLEAGADTNARTDYKCLSPLHIAAERGQADIARLLLAKGGDPHARTKSGATPFYRCARGGSMEILEMLKSQGVDINARTWDSWTPLLEAVFAGNLPFVNRLLEWKADTSVRDRSGYTPMDWAKELEAWDIVESLTIHEIENQAAEISLKTLK